MFFQRFDCVLMGTPHLLAVCHLGHFSQSQMFQVNNIIQGGPKNPGNTQTGTESRDSPDVDVKIASQCHWNSSLNRVVALQLTPQFMPHVLHRALNTSFLLYFLQ